MSNNLQPFHLSIMSSLWQASASDLEAFGQLLKKTLIIANYDMIIKAWQERCQQTGYQDNIGVANSLIAQRDRNKTPHDAHIANAANLVVGPGIVQDFKFSKS